MFLSHQFVQMCFVLAEQSPHTIEFLEKLAEPAPKNLIGLSNSFFRKLTKKRRFLAFCYVVFVLHSSSAFFQIF